MSIRVFAYPDPIQPTRVELEAELAAQEWSWRLELRQLVDQGKAAQLEYSAALDDRGAVASRVRATLAAIALRAATAAMEFVWLEEALGLITVEQAAEAMGVARELEHLTDRARADISAAARIGKLIHLVRPRPVEGAFSWPS